MIFDVAIVGAGLIGLATARELLNRHPRLHICIVDKAGQLAAHQSGHNSGVIHSGVYYNPGSLKAALCVAGNRALYRYCEERAIPVEQTGKVIVATVEAELARLDELLRRGKANGVVGVAILSRERLSELEPHCLGIRALWSPSAGVVDYSALAASFAHDIEESGSDIRLASEVLGIAVRPTEVILTTRAGEVAARTLISCAGLHADVVARMTGGAAFPTIVPFRGGYWQLRENARHLCRNLIYPVPDLSFPFLGIHATRQVTTGEVWLGPNAVFAFAREGYSRFNLRLPDLYLSVRDRGFRRLVRRHWRMGMAEMWRDWSKRAFLKAARRYLPDLGMNDLVAGPSGVRAQALNADGTLVDDFIIEAQGNRVLHVRNAPSPAATSSMEIARFIVASAERKLAL